MQAVVDTNVWVCAFLMPGGTAAKLLAAMYAGRLRPMVSEAIEAECQSVLKRAKFSIQAQVLTDFFYDLRTLGQYADQVPPMDIKLPDPNDAPFIALARYAGCPVITGNTKHFPTRAGIVVLTPAQYVDSLIQQRG